MSDPVTELVKAHPKPLRLPARARELERLSRAATASDPNSEQFRLRLAEAKRAARAAHAREGRSKNAAFPVAKDFDTSDFGVMPTLSQPKLRARALCELLFEPLSRTFFDTFANDDPAQR
jgi:DNA replication protein DnaC